MIAEIAFLLFVTIAIVVAIAVVASVLSGSPAFQIVNSVLGKVIDDFEGDSYFIIMKILFDLKALATRVFCVRIRISLFTYQF